MIHKASEPDILGNGLTNEQTAAVYVIASVMFGGKFNRLGYEAAYILYTEGMLLGHQSGDSTVYCRTINEAGRKTRERQVTERDISINYSFPQSLRHLPGYTKMRWNPDDEFYV